MADSPNIVRNTENTPHRPSVQPADTAKVIDSEGRGAIMTALGEGSGEGQEAGIDAGRERVSEVREGAREQKGDAAGKKTGDGKKSSGDDAGAGFVFDDQHLPPAPTIIKRIEDDLRRQIRQLEKKATQYKGGWFGLRSPDYHKYNETMSEIRERHVLLKRIVSMAYDALKKLYIQMFRPKDTK
jgi:hypothetical protein